VVFGPEVADGEGTSIEVATPAVDLKTGTTEDGGPLTEVITAGALRKLEGRITISHRQEGTAPTHRASHPSLTCPTLDKTPASLSETLWQSVAAIM